MIAVLSAMQSEVDLLLNQMEGAMPVTLCGGVYTVGKIAGRDVAVGAASIGKTNAAIGAQAVIDRFRPTHLVHTGIAGSLSPRAGLLSVVLGESITFHDFSHDIMRSYPPYREFFHSDPRLMGIAERYLISQGDAYLKGLIATGDQFIESAAQKKAITDRMPALCADMESAAIACCCFVNNVPCLVVRAISDLADEESHDTYDRHKRSASDVGAGMVVSILRQI